VLVFWWTGKGYLTAVILLAVLTVFGIVLQAGRSMLEDAAWFWGLAVVTAAGLNWHVGRRQNARKLAAVKSSRLRDRLFYPARNRFMSLPLETWSIPLAVGGVAAIGYGLLAR
jgi:hypothetical protein